MDLGIRNAAIRVQVALGNGDGTFQKPSASLLIETASFPWVVVGDFHMDRQSDMAFGTIHGIELYLNACRLPLEPPNGLWIQRRNQAVTLSWPSTPAGALLESTTEDSLTGWREVLGNFITNQNRLELEAPIEGAQRYFRLRDPAP